MKHILERLEVELFYLIANSINRLLKYFGHNTPVNHTYSSDDLFTIKGDNRVFLVIKCEHNTQGKFPLIDSLDKVIIKFENVNSTDSGNVDTKECISPLVPCNNSSPLYTALDICIQKDYVQTFVFQTKPSVLTQLSYNYLYMYIKTKLYTFNNWCLEPDFVNNTHQFYTSLLFSCYKKDIAQLMKCYGFKITKTQTNTIIYIFNNIVNYKNLPNYLDNIE